MSNVIQFSLTDPLPGVLVTGANGYVGSQLCKLLKSQGYRVLAIDLAFEPRHQYFEHYETCSYHNVLILRMLMEKYNVKTVYHVGASSLVAPSFQHPWRYYSNNVGSLADLIALCVELDVEKFIFSSSAAVYGDARSSYGICKEYEPMNPVNPYGASKMVGERLLNESVYASNLNVVALRYFNVAGADHKDSDLGQEGGATHALARIMEAARAETTFSIFGSDYKTPDGTAIRDYVHVEDVAWANLLAARYLDDNPGFSAFNIGQGKGTSVKEIFDETNRVLGINNQCDYAPRRVGDPPVLVADISMTIESLGWEPKHSLHEIIQDANAWYTYSPSHPRR